MGHSKKSYFLLLFALFLPAHVSTSMAGVSVSVSVDVAPPPLPDYEQPVCPDAGYMWQPGYWAYGPDGYYWVPGIWVLAPQPGLLWTPGYWGWSGGVYVWNEGYWGRHVGYYGGVCYGFGYTGVGFYGGRWNHGVYYYNRSVANVNVTVVHNVYAKTVIKSPTISRVSFNGGTGGTLAKPTAKELVAVREKHIPPTAQQSQHMQSAGANHAFLASTNHGQPSRADLAKHAAATNQFSRTREPSIRYSQPQHDPRSHWQRQGR